MLRRRTYATFVAMWAVLGVMIAIALACGPAATPSATNQASPATPTATIWWLGDTPSPSEFATLEAMPTPTPYPPGYVKPTDPPYSPPRTDAEIRATLGASIATEEAQWPSRASAETPTPQPTPTPAPLTTQVTRFARNGDYDAVAHVRVGSSRNVTLPANFEWPANTKPWDELTRTTITAITSYYGTLPAAYELITPQWLGWAKPNGGSEYVFFIIKSFKHSDECTGDPIPGRRCFNQTQLDAMGGAGGFYIGEQAWVIEGNQAWRIPDENPLPLPLPANFELIENAKSVGRNLSLSDLEAAIRQGLTE